MLYLYNNINPSAVIINSICKDSNSRNRLVHDISLYNYEDVSKEILSGMAVLDKNDNTITVKPYVFNQEFIEQNNQTRYYKSIMSGFKKYTSPDSIIDDDIIIVLNKCKIDVNFEIYMNIDESYINLELVPLMNKHEEMMTFLVNKERL